MNRNLKYLLSLTTGIMVITGNLIGGWWVAMNLIFSFGFLAILDGIKWEDKSNESDEDAVLPDVILILQCVLQTVCIGTFIHIVYSGNLNVAQIILAAVSTGINTGSGGTVNAHELIHRKNPIFQFLGKYLLFTSFNIYFYVDHLKVHHKWVGTKKDAATSLYGESLYTFFIRTVRQQIVNAWTHEIERLNSEKRFVYGFGNYVISSLILIIAFCSMLYFYFGVVIVLAVWLQAFVGTFLLEYTNYIEHYGLLRNENERVTEAHSWQSDKVISRFVLIDLSRHADHHYYSSKPYHTLQSYPNAPVLPGGYAQMIYYALIPSLWFKTIHPILKEKGFGTASS